MIKWIPNIKLFKKLFSNCKKMFQRWKKLCQWKQNLLYLKRNTMYMDQYLCGWNFKTQKKCSDVCIFSSCFSNQLLKCKKKKTSTCTFRYKHTQTQKKILKRNSVIISYFQNRCLFLVRESWTHKKKYKININKKHLCKFPIFFNIKNDQP